MYLYKRKEYLHLEMFNTKIGISLDYLSSDRTGKCDNTDLPFASEKDSG